MVVSHVRGTEDSDDLVKRAGGKEIHLNPADFEFRESYMRILRAIDADPSLLDKHRHPGKQAGYQETTSGPRYHFIQKGGGLLTKGTITITRS